MCLNDYLKTTLRRFLTTETTNEVVTTPHYPGFNLYAFFILFHARRECDYVKHVLLAHYFTSITVCNRVKGGKKSRIPLFFFHIAFPNSSFVSINKKQTNKQGTLYREETTLKMCPVDSQFAAQTYDFPNSQHTGKNILHPVLKFWRIPLPG